MIKPVQRTFEKLRINRQYYNEIPELETKLANDLRGHKLKLLGMESPNKI